MGMPSDKELKEHGFEYYEPFPPDRGGGNDGRGRPRVLQDVIRAYEGSPLRVQILEFSGGV